MKHLVLFVFTLCSSVPIFAQSYNDIIIDNALENVNGYAYIGWAKQTEESIRSLDSLHIGMIITKKRLQESNEWEYGGIDTMYVEGGKITTHIQFRDCYTAKYDTKGRLTEKCYSSTPSSSMKKQLTLNYDASGFPIYSRQDNEDGTIMEKTSQPYYNAQGNIDSIAYPGNVFPTRLYETFKQDTYKNGDSIVITHSSYEPRFVDPHNEYFVRTVHHDTVYVRISANYTDNVLEFTQNYLNGREVKSSFFDGIGESSWATVYNRLGLPVESFGNRMTNSGSGNLVMDYEYYTVDPQHKQQFRLVNLE